MSLSRFKLYIPKGKKNFVLTAKLKKKKKLQKYKCNKNTLWSHCKL